MTALLEGLGVALSSASLPAESRWGTLGETMMEVTAGVVVHNILPRAFRCAFGAEGQEERQENDEDDWHASMHKKSSVR